MKKSWIVVETCAAALALTVLVGWGSPKPAPSGTPTPIATATATPSPSVTPKPTATPSPTPTPSPTASPSSDPALSWEAGHSERAEWSKSVYKYLRKYWSYDAASDVSFFYPKWSTASGPTKLHAMAEMWVAIAYYESSWNPKSASVDVGKPDTRDTWSIGLLQMSVTDQGNYGFKFGYTYDDLLTAAPNLELGIAIMQKQISRHGKLMLNTTKDGLYWEVMSPVNSSNHTKEIAARIQKAVTQ